jgi:hypothetical protein
MQARPRWGTVFSEIEACKPSWKQHMEKAQVTGQNVSLG